MLEWLTFSYILMYLLYKYMVRFQDHSAQRWFTTNMVDWCIILKVGLFKHVKFPFIKCIIKYFIFVQYKYMACWLKILHCCFCEIQFFLISLSDFIHFLNPSSMVMFRMCERARILGYIVLKLYLKIHKVKIYMRKYTKLVQNKEYLCSDKYPCL